LKGGHHRDTKGSIIMFKKTKAEDGVIEFQSVKQSRLKMLILIGLVGVFFILSILFAILFATADGGGGMPVGVNRISISHHMPIEGQRTTASIGAQYRLNIDLEIVGEEISPSLEFEVINPVGHDNALIFEEGALYRVSREQFQLNFRVAANAELHNQRVTVIFTSAGQREIFDFYVVLRHAVSANFSSHVHAVGNQSNHIINEAGVTLPFSSDAARRVFSVDVVQLGLGGADVSVGIVGQDGRNVEDLGLSLTGDNIIAFDELRTIQSRGERVYFSLIGEGSATINVTVNAFNTAENIVLSLLVASARTDDRLESLTFRPPPGLQHFSAFIFDLGTSPVLFNQASGNVEFFPQISNPLWSVVEVYPNGNPVLINRTLNIVGGYRITPERVGVTYIKLVDETPNGFGFTSEPMQFVVMQDTNRVNVNADGTNEFAQGQRVSLNVELGVTMTGAAMPTAFVFPHQAIRQGIIFRYHSNDYLPRYDQGWNFEPSVNYHTIVFTNMFHYLYDSNRGVHYFKVPSIDSFRTRREGNTNNFTGYGTIEMVVGRGTTGMTIQFYSAAQRSVIPHGIVPGRETNETPTPPAGGYFYRVGNSFVVGVRQAVAGIGFIASSALPSIHATSRFYFSNELNSQVLIRPAVRQGGTPNAELTVGALLRFLNAPQENGGTDIPQYTGVGAASPQNVRVLAGGLFHSTTWAIPNYACGTRILVTVQVTYFGIVEYSRSFYVIFAEMIDLSDIEHGISAVNGGAFSATNVSPTATSHFVSLGNVGIPNSTAPIFTNIIFGGVPSRPARTMMFFYTTGLNQTDFFISDNGLDPLSRNDAVFRIHGNQLFMLRDLKQIYVQEGINLLNFEIVFSAFPIVATNAANNNWEFYLNWARSYLLEGMTLTPTQMFISHMRVVSIVTRRMFDEVGFFNVDGDGNFTDVAQVEGVNQRININNTIAFFPSGVFHFSTGRHILGRVENQYLAFTSHPNRQHISGTPNSVIHPVNSNGVTNNISVLRTGERSFNVTRPTTATTPYFGFVDARFYLRVGTFEVPFVTRVYSRVLAIQSIDLFFSENAAENQIVAYRLGSNFLVPFVLNQLNGNADFSVFARVVYQDALGSQNFLRREGLALYGVSDNLSIEVVGFRGSFLPADSGAIEIFEVRIRNNSLTPSHFPNVNIVSAGDNGVRHANNFQINISRVAENMRFTYANGNTSTNITLDMLSDRHQTNSIGTLLSASQTRDLDVGGGDRQQRGALGRYAFDVRITGGEFLNPVNPADRTDFFALAPNLRPFYLSFDADGRLIIETRGRAGQYTLHISISERMFRRGTHEQMTMPNNIVNLDSQNITINVNIRADLANVRVVSIDDYNNSLFANEIGVINLFVTGGAGNSYFELGIVQNVCPTTNTLLARPTLPTAYMGSLFINFRVEVVNASNVVIAEIPFENNRLSFPNNMATLSGLRLQVAWQLVGHSSQSVEVLINITNRAIDGITFTPLAMNQFEQYIDGQSGAYAIRSAEMLGITDFGLEIKSHGATSYQAFDISAITNIEFDSINPNIVTIETLHHRITISLSGTTAGGVATFSILGRTPIGGGNWTNVSNGVTNHHVIVNLNTVANPFHFIMTPSPIAFQMFITITPRNMAGLNSGTSRSLSLLVSSYDQINAITYVSSGPNTIPGLEPRVASQDANVTNLTLPRNFVLNLGHYVQFTTQAITIPFPSHGNFNFNAISTGVYRIGTSSSLTMLSSTGTGRERVTISAGAGAGAVIRHFDILIVEPFVTPTFGTDIATQATTFGDQAGTPFVNFNIVPQTNAMYVRFQVGAIDHNTFGMNSPQLSISPDQGADGNFFIVDSVSTNQQLAAGTFIFRIRLNPHEDIYQLIHSTRNRFFHMNLSVFISGQSVLIGETAMLRLIVEPTGNVRDVAIRHSHEQSAVQSGDVVVSNNSVNVQGSRYFRVSINNSNLVDLLSNVVLRSQIQIDFRAYLSTSAGNITVSRVGTNHPTNSPYAIFRVDWPPETGAPSVVLSFSVEVTIFGVVFPRQDVFNANLHNVGQMPIFFGTIGYGQTLTDGNIGAILVPNPSEINVTFGGAVNPRQNLRVVIDFSGTGFTFTNDHLSTLRFFISSPILTFENEMGQSRIHNNRIYAILTINFNLFTQTNTSFLVNFSAQINHNNLVYVSNAGSVTLRVNPPSLAITADEVFDGTASAPIFTLSPTVGATQRTVNFSIASGIANVGVPVSHINAIAVNSVNFFGHGNSINPVFTLNINPANRELLSIVIFRADGISFGGTFIVTLSGTFDSGVFFGQTFAIDVTIIIQETSPPSVNLIAGVDNVFQMSNTNQVIAIGERRHAGCTFESDFIEFNLGNHGVTGVEIATNDIFGVNPTTIVETSGASTNGMIQFNAMSNLLIFTPLRAGEFVITLRFRVTSGYWQHIVLETQLTLVVLPRMELLLTQNNLTLGDEVVATARVIGALNELEGFTNGLGGEDIATANIFSNFGTVSNVSRTGTTTTANIRLISTRIAPAQITAEIVLGGRFRNVALTTDSDMAINHLELVNFSQGSASVTNNQISVLSGTTIQIDREYFRFNNLTDNMSTVMLATVVGNPYIQVASFSPTGMIIAVSEGLFDNETFAVEATLTVRIRRATNQYFQSSFQVVATRKPSPIATVNFRANMIHTNTNDANVTNGFILHVGETLNLDITGISHEIQNITLITSAPEFISVSRNANGLALTAVALMSGVNHLDVTLDSMSIMIYGQWFNVLTTAGVNRVWNTSNSQTFNSLRLQPNTSTNVAVSQDRYVILANQSFEVYMSLLVGQFEYFSLDVNFVGNQRVTGMRLYTDGIGGRIHVPTTAFIGAGLLNGTFRTTAIIDASRPRIIIVVSTGNNGPATVRDINLHVTLRYRLLMTDFEDSPRVRRSETLHSVQSIGLTAPFTPQVSALSLSYERSGANNIYVTPQIIDNRGNDVTNWVTAPVNYVLGHSFGVASSTVVVEPVGVNRFRIVLNNNHGNDFLVNLNATLASGGTTTTAALAIQGANWMQGTGTLVIDSLSLNHTLTGNQIDITPIVLDTRGVNVTSQINQTHITFAITHAHGVASSSVLGTNGFRINLVATHGGDFLAVVRATVVFGAGANQRTLVTYHSIQGANWQTGTPIIDSLSLGHNLSGNQIDITPTVLDVRGLNVTSQINQTHITFAITHAHGVASSNVLGANGFRINLVPTHGGDFLVVLRATVTFGVGVNQRTLVTYHSIQGSATSVVASLALDSLRNGNQIDVTSTILDTRGLNMTNQINSTHITFDVIQGSEFVLNSGIINNNQYRLNLVSNHNNEFFIVLRATVNFGAGMNERTITTFLVIQA